MTTIRSRIEENLRTVRDRMAAACVQAGRPADDVRLIAVTKYAEWEWVKALIDLGQLDLGESRPQQLAERAQRAPANVRWHMIGHLQRNKVSLVLPRVACIHSVDSLRLLREIDQTAGKLSLQPRVLLEVNISGEASKDGFIPADLRRDWEACQQLPHVRVDGFMTMAPLTDDPEAARQTFEGLRNLRDELHQPERELRELSMGMTNDFETAIAAGATCVRIGSALFEGLSEPRP